jgi:hypothetical protein
MAQIILLVLVIIFFLGYYLIKSLNDFFKTAQKSHRQEVKIKRKLQDHSVIHQHYNVSTDLGLDCLDTKKCDERGCKNGAEYGMSKCLSCDGISSDALWVKPCQKCNNSRLVDGIIGICKKCQGKGFLPYDAHLQVADANFPEKMTWQDSINACSSLGDGWRLPTREQLQGMLLFDKEGRGNFHSGWYWSSSEDDKDKAWSFYFKSGKDKDYHGHSFSKDSTFHVRAVRDLP